MTLDAHYHRNDLLKLLTDSLPDGDESSVSEHLATCAACRHEFEVLAATNEWWQEATARLSKSAVRKKERESTGASSRDDDLHFTTDFAVDFLDPSDDRQALGRLGEYEISEVIGRGGMGIVLKGFQKELHRHVAVKVLSPHLATSGAARRRFAREAQATAAIVHPHVMAIHSVNANAKLPYLVMPFVACESLQERIDRHGPLDVKDVLRIGMQAALGLAAAHAQGIVHRDVKPANILLETNVDRVLLTDFGLARAVDDATLTRTGIIAGTPQYMSPEQANGDVVDHRSDLFSLGGVLYAMCTARPPFRAETTFGVLRRIRETAPRSIREINPDIPEWLERIVMRLLAKEMVERFSAASDVAALLEQCLAHVQQPMSTPLPESVNNRAFAEGESDALMIRPHGKRNQVVASSIVGLVLVIGLGVWLSWPKQRIESPASNAESVSIKEPSKAPASSPVAANEKTEPVNLPPSDWDEVNRKLDMEEDLIDQLEATIGNESMEPTSFEKGTE